MNALRTSCPLLVPEAIRASGAFYPQYRPRPRSVLEGLRNAHTDSCHRRRHSADGRRCRACIPPRRSKERSLDDVSRIRRPGCGHLHTAGDLGPRFPQWPQRPAASSTVVTKCELRLLRRPHGRQHRAMAERRRPPKRLLHHSVGAKGRAMAVDIRRPAHTESAARRSSDTFGAKGILQGPGTRTASHKGAVGETRTRWCCA
jgi:hypothetical protein